MIVPPYYHLVSREGLYRHYKAVADSIDIGIMAYNNAITSKIYIHPPMLARLSRIPNIVACKENVWNIMAFYAAAKAVNPKDMVMICGVGHMMYKYEAPYGATGYVTEPANFVPHVAIRLYKACQKGDHAEIEKWSDAIAPYVAFVGRMAAKRGPLGRSSKKWHEKQLSCPFPWISAGCRLHNMGFAFSKRQTPSRGVVSRKRETCRLTRTRPKGCWSQD